MTDTEDHKEARVYEIGYLVLPSVGEDNLPQVVKKLVSIIEKAGATPLDSEDPYIQELEYSMSKTIGARKYVVDEAYIGWMKFEGESNQVEEIKKGVDATEEILRNLLIKAPRETAFTFAKAREARQAAEDTLNAPVAEEAVAAEEPAVDVVPPVLE